jgi:hypothetical protein
MAQHLHPSLSTTIVASFLVPYLICTFVLSLHYRVFPIIPLRDSHLSLSSPPPYALTSTLSWAETRSFVISTVTRSNFNGVTFYVTVTILTSLIVRARSLYIPLCSCFRSGSRFHFIVTGSYALRVRIVSFVGSQWTPSGRVG